MNELKRIKATLVKEIYKNDTNLYKVIKVKTIDDEYLTVVGNFYPLSFDVLYEFVGKYQNSKYGLQFLTNEVYSALDTKEALEKYLQSDNFKGIGKTLSKRIVDTIGINLINNVIENKEILSHVKGLSKKHIDLIYENFLNIDNKEKTLIKLLNLGLTSNQASKIIEKYEDNAINILMTNPYRLVYDIDGFGFKRCDLIAKGLGIENNDPNRIKEGILYTLEVYSYESGNTYILIDELIKRSMILLELSLNDENIIYELIKDLENKKRIVVINQKVFLINLYKAEYGIKKLLLNFKSNYSYDGNSILDAIKIVEKNNKINYTEEQKNAVISSLSSNVSIITGGPGTGKTTIVKCIIDVYKILNNDFLENDLTLVAPTGKAAKRLQDVTNYKASTIHKAFQILIDNYKEFSILSTKVLIIDESSMIDVELAYRILQALKDDTKIIFIGDVNQLPSVSPGTFFKDIVTSNVFKVIKLNHVMRQVSDSNIIKLSNMVLNGSINKELFKEQKEVFFYKSIEDEFFDILIQLLNKYLTKNDSFDKLIILIPIYAGIVGIDKINELIQEKYIKNDVFINYQDKIFYLNDKVIQLNNDRVKKVFNGDVGKIVKIYQNNDTKYIDIDFQGQIVTYKENELDNIRLAYAISVHKSQGSEYDEVIFPIFKSYSIMLYKKLIYTAVTRAKKHLFLFGDLNLFERKITYEEIERNTYLYELLTSKDDDKDTSFIINDYNYISIDDPKSAFSKIIEDLTVSIDDFVDN